MVPTTAPSTVTWVPSVAATTRKFWPCGIVGMKKSLDHESTGNSISST